MPIAQAATANPDISRVEPDDESFLDHGQFKLYGDRTRENVRRLMASTGKTPASIEAATGIPMDQYLAGQHRLSAGDGFHLAAHLGVTITELMAAPVKPRAATRAYILDAIDRMAAADDDDAIEQCLDVVLSWHNYKFDVKVEGSPDRFGRACLVALCRAFVEETIHDEPLTLMLEKALHLESCTKQYELEKLDRKPVTSDSTEVA